MSGFLISDKLTIFAKSLIINIMKKIILAICICLLCALMLGGCGVKSPLQHDPDYPRNYPVY